VWPKGLLTGFAAIFFSESGDAGQISAAMLASQHQAPLVIWFGATLALVTKGILAVTVGVEVRRHLPRRVLHFGALTLCLTMSVLAALRLQI
jgi:putative Ca2+/H+ antiporter (TMEM165/GDT1 family)